MRKFGGGESFRVSHQDHNRWQNAGLAHAMRQFGGQEATSFPDWASDGIVLVKNNTGRNLPRYSVLTILGSIPDPNYSTEQLADFKNFVQVKGEEPSSEITGRFCILQTDANAGQVVPAMLSGVTPCRINVLSLTDEFADIETNEAVDRTRYLKTGSSGGAQIIHRPEILGEQWAYVRISNKPAEGVKIVSASSSTLYAAFGGGGDTNANIDYGNVESNTAAISDGNYVPLSSGSLATQRRRITYARDCTVWERNSEGVLAATEETISCFNPGSLPIPRFTLCYAQKFGDAWVIIGRVMPHAADTRHFIMTPSSPIEVAGDSFSAKFMRSGTIAPKFPSSSPLTDWAHDDDADVYIHHPGTYEITYGVEVARGSNDSVDTTEWTDSNSDTLDLPNPRSVECELIANWNPAGGALSGNWGQGNELKVVLPPRMAGYVSAEKTFMVTHTLDTWHGQPYMRLSLAIGKCSAVDPAGTVQLGAAWVSIRAAGSCVEGGNQGSGYNAFLGTSGAFQWYGGGTAPTAADFGEDGT